MSIVRRFNAALVHNAVAVLRGALYLYATEGRDALPGVDSEAALRE